MKEPLKEKKTWSNQAGTAGATIRPTILLIDVIITNSRQESNLNAQPLTHSHYNQSHKQGISDY